MEEAANQDSLGNTVLPADVPYFQEFDDDVGGRSYLSDEDGTTSGAATDSPSHQRPRESSEELSPIGGGSVARRNERERKRVRMVNMGFAKLRQYVPLAARGKRLSKVETLRSAIDYIRQLRQLLLFHQQQRVEEPPVYYHLYDQQHQQQQRMYQPYDYARTNPAPCCYDGLEAARLPAEMPLECGVGFCGWSLSNSSESPCPSVESEMTSSPPYPGPLDVEAQLPCWTI